MIVPGDGHRIQAAATPRVRGFSGGAQRRDQPPPNGVTDTVTPPTVTPAHTTSEYLLCAELFSSRAPFRLWGRPVLVDNNATVEAVDLHVGQRRRAHRRCQVARRHPPDLPSLALRRHQTGSGPLHL